jgi:hypothetical protein
VVHQRRNDPLAELESFKNLTSLNSEDNHRELHHEPQALSARIYSRGTSPGILNISLFNVGFRRSPAGNFYFFGNTNAFSRDLFAFFSLYQTTAAILADRIQKVYEEDNKMDYTERFLGSRVALLERTSAHCPSRATPSKAALSFLVTSLSEVLSRALCS